MLVLQDLQKNLDKMGETGERDRKVISGGHWRGSRHRHAKNNKSHIGPCPGVAQPITWLKDGALSQRMEESLQVSIATVMLSEPCSRNISKIET